MTLAAADLTRQNLLDSPSAALDLGGLYWLVYAADQPADLGNVADAINAKSTDWIVLGGGSQTDTGVAVPVKLSVNAGNTIVDALVDPIRELDLGTDYTIGGWGIGPHIGSGAVLKLQFMVPAQLYGADTGTTFTAEGSAVLGAAKATGQLENSVTKTLKAGVSTATATVSGTFSTLKVIAILLLVAAVIYGLGKLRG